MNVGIKQLRNMHKNPPRYPHKVIYNNCQEWDDRFYLDKIPEYNPLEDEHCRIYGEAGRRYSKPKAKPHAILAPGRLRVIKAQPSIERDNSSII